MEKVEIYHILENGRLVAVLDTGSVEDEVSIVKEIIQTDGVMDVQLAYHNFEDLEDLQS
jgi:nitrate reductase NapAB chaperone NapD